MVLLEICRVSIDEWGMAGKNGDDSGAWSFFSASFGLPFHVCYLEISPECCMYRQCEGSMFHVW